METNTNKEDSADIAILVHEASHTVEIKADMYSRLPAIFRILLDLQ